MRIWIISSSVDIFVLFRFLQKYNFSYTVFFDQEWWEWMEKDENFVLPRVEALIKKALDSWVNKLILPPTIELIFLSDEKYSQYKEVVLPLFSKYLLEQCLPYSRIGKIGFLGDRFDEKNQQYLKDVSSKLVYTDNQKATKSFPDVFSFWFKQVRMWKYFTMQLWWKNWMIHNVVKKDIAFFLDAWVDTLIPCNYWFMAYDKAIAKIVRSKKINWFWLDSVENIFSSLCEKNDTKWNYNIKIVYTWHVDYILWSKKLVWLLQKGKQTEITSVKISL